MRSIYEQYPFAEVIEDHHAARLIISDEPPKKAIKRDCLKYQQLKCIKKKPTVPAVSLQSLAHA